MPESIFDVDFCEVRNHVFCLVLGVIDLFDSVKNNGKNDFVRHYTGIVKKVFVALLYALNSGFEHVFGLTVYAHAYC